MVAFTNFTTAANYNRHVWPCCPFHSTLKDISCDPSPRNSCRCAQHRSHSPFGCRSGISALPNHAQAFPLRHRGPRHNRSRLPCLESRLQRRRSPSRCVLCFAAVGSPALAGSLTTRGGGSSPGGPNAGPPQSSFS